MNEMNMPGFTAETSLYKTSGRYSHSSGCALGACGQAVIPQLRKTDLECWHDCREAGGTWGECDFSCTEYEEEGGGGPPEPVCIPSCTRCSRVPGEPGLWKTCITRDCEDHLIRCDRGVPVLGHRAVALL